MVKKTEWTGRYLKKGLKAFQAAIYIPGETVPPHRMDGLNVLKSV